MGDGNNEKVKKLASYIRKQRKAGYSITTLRNYLISNGYDPRLVNAAIDYSYKEAAPKKIPLKLIVIILVCIVVVGGLGLTISKLVSKEKAPEIQMPKTVKLPDIKFPEVKKEEKPVEKKDVFFGEEEKEVKKPKPVTKLETGVKLTKDEIVKEKQEPSILGIERQVADISESAGVDLCKSLTERKANACYKKLAITHNESKYCEKVTSSGLRDNCYIVFAFAGDFTICDKIVNKYHQLNCRSLGRARTYQSEELLAQMVANATSS
ncbi:MAG: hypothetical protein KAT43_01725 [Nanoarchaeota archaeon]|nr:hypothetical protein [Nanoarchaeota archaeon]